MNSYDAEREERARLLEARRLVGGLKEQLTWMQKSGTVVKQMRVDATNCIIEIDTNAGTGFRVTVERI